MVRNVSYMARAWEKGELVFPGIIQQFENPHRFKELKNALYAKKWVVHVKDPIKKPEYVLEYLGRYTHRVAIANHRIESLKDGMVTFKYKNRETNRMEPATIEAVEFIRRFLLHVLPKRFVKIRHYGFLSNRNKKSNVARIRLMCGVAGDVKAAEKSVEEMMLKLTGVDITLCACCKKGKMRVVSRIPEKTGLCPAAIMHPMSWRETG
jgi:hypothetical protein